MNVTIQLFRGALLVTLAAGGASAVVASAAEAVGFLNDTGQVRCYAPDYAEVPCDDASTGDASALPRQDARYGRDAAAAVGRLVKIGGGVGGFDLSRICMSGDVEGEGDCPLAPPVPEDLEQPAPNEWACIRDNVTGLTWTLGNPVRASWAEASSTDEGSFIHRANSLARCGLDAGWRLPVRREGHSLVHVARKFPAADPAYFPVWDANAQTGMGFWTTDASVRYPAVNHLIDVDGGELAVFQCRETVPALPCRQLPPGVKRWEASVLLVNGAWRSPGDLGTAERWSVGANGTVKDEWSGLVWDRCSWGQTGSDCAGAATLFPAWNDAMQVAGIANQQRHRGYQDWRMPNVKELETLVKMDAFAPSIDSEVFPNTSRNYYWTSSSSWLAFPETSEMAMGVTFQDGITTRLFKIETLPNRSFVRLVRGGQPWDAFDGIGDVLYSDDFEPAPMILR